MFRNNFFQSISKDAYFPDQKNLSIFVRSRNEGYRKRNNSGGPDY